MRKTKGLFTVLFVFFFILATQTAWAAPQVDGNGAVLIDAASGQVLYEMDKDEKLPPASTTKILTAIIAIESGKLDETVTVGPNPPKLEGTRIYLVEGEKVKLRSLVETALIDSANDSALAIAEYLGGSQEQFANMMNEKARALGAVNSNFVSPHGLSSENHYTTAYDLALIARYAMNNEIFRGIVKTKTLDWSGQAWQTRLININRMLWDYDGADGIKTGYTKESKNTIVASAVRDGRRLIAVVLGSPGTGVYESASSLLDYGFKNFQQLELTTPEVSAATVRVNDKTTLSLMPREKSVISLPVDSNAKIESYLDLKALPPKIAQGQVMGQQVFTVDGVEYARVDLLAGGNITVKTGFTKILINLAAGLFLLQVLYRMLRMALRKKRRRARSGIGSFSRDYRY